VRCGDERLHIWEKKKRDKEWKRLTWTA